MCHTGPRSQPHAPTRGHGALTELGVCLTVTAGAPLPTLQDCACYWIRVRLLTLYLGYVLNPTPMTVNAPEQPPPASASQTPVSHLPGNRSSPDWCRCGSA